MKQIQELAALRAKEEEETKQRAKDGEDFMRLLFPKGREKESSEKRES
jgi:hypothetical protein